MTTGHTYPLVVVIDDDSSFLELMGEVLADAGYRAVGWRTSREALERLCSRPPAALIVDLRIEHADAGWHLLDALRRHAALQQLPVIICSADARGLRERAAELRRANWRVVPKPFDLDDLLGALAALAGPGMHGHPTASVCAA